MNDVKFMETVDGKLLRSLGPFGFIAVDPVYVDLDDMCNMRPGAIVRVRGNPYDAIRVYALPESDTLGCIASWISEEC